MIVVVDLDAQDEVRLRAQLEGVLEAFPPGAPKPITRFCLAIEEGEAWLLGDAEAIKAAYPKAKLKPLRAYKQDSICGTWEVLADVVYPGGVKKLKPQGYPLVGKVKCEWAEKIAPRLTLEENRSPSFQALLSVIRALRDGPPAA